MCVLVLGVVVAVLCIGVPVADVVDIVFNVLIFLHFLCSLIPHHHHHHHHRRRRRHHHHHHHNHHCHHHHIILHCFSCCCSCYYYWGCAYDWNAWDMLYIFFWFSSYSSTKIILFFLSGFWLLSRNNEHKQRDDPNPSLFLHSLQYPFLCQISLWKTQVAFISKPNKCFCFLLHGLVCAQKGNPHFEAS